MVDEELCRWVYGIWVIVGFVTSWWLDFSLLVADCVVVGWR